MNIGFTLLMKKKKCIKYIKYYDARYVIIHKYILSSKIDVLDIHQISLKSFV